MKRAERAGDTVKRSCKGLWLPGRAEAARIGKSVRRFKPGDEVLGGADGSFAEFTVTIGLLILAASGMAVARYM